MNAIHDLRSALMQYDFAFIFLALLCLVTLIQNFLLAPIAFASNEQEPGMPVRLDHNALSFRAIRTYQNSIETLPVFGFALIVAIIAGVSPWWVNLIAGVYLGFRLLFWAIYYSGIGKVTGGPRTIAFVGGLIANVALAIMAVYSTIQLL